MSEGDTQPGRGRTADFGYEVVDEHEKARRVGGVFSSVASRYDLMNDLMSGGLHRVWKAIAIEVCHARAGEHVLDIATGTGDLAARLWRRVGPTGSVVLSDINAAMLERGRNRMLDEGMVATAVRCDAEQLPFVENRFDIVTVAFGLRNMTHKDVALREMFRVLRPGGRLIVLEFSRVWKPLAPLYDAYSFGVLPMLGRLVARDSASYRYLAESIRMHPDQARLAAMMEEAGFERVTYLNMAAGVVAVHRGFKLG